MISLPESWRATHLNHCLGIICSLAPSARPGFLLCLTYLIDTTYFGGADTKRGCREAGNLGRQGFDRGK